jgi:2-oxoglutarate ferredoxin oxidoreductase subunit delta
MEGSLGYVEIDGRRCKGCELCVVACPRNLIRLSPGINELGYHPAEFIGIEDARDRARGCTGCALCGLTCPETGIAVFR